MLGNEANYIFWNCMLEMIELCFLSENRNAMLKIRQLDISNHSPLKSANKASF